MPVVLFIAFFGLGYLIGEGGEAHDGSADEYEISNILLIDSGRFSFPVFPLPFLNMK